MKKHLAITALIITAMAVLLPFASSNPDGLENLISTSKAQQQHAPFWNGLMSNYTIEAIGNPYLSTFLAGLFGTLMVILATLILTYSITPKRKNAK